jgi:hypothetical protein
MGETEPAYELLSILMKERPEAFGYQGRLTLFIEVAVQAASQAAAAGDVAAARERLECALAAVPDSEARRVSIWKLAAERVPGLIPSTGTTVDLSAPIGYEPGYHLDWWSWRMHASWDPAGRLLAYAPPRQWTDEYGRKIWLLDLDDGGMRVIETKQQVRLLAGLSPDAGAILYIDGSTSQAESGYRRLVLADGSENSLPRAAGGHDAAAWSPDGKKVSFADGEGIRACNPDGSDVAVVVKSRQPPEAGPHGDPSFPVWSPDGGSIGYSIDLDAGHGGGVVAIAATDLSSGRETRSDFVGFWDVAWSPDGQWLAAHDCSSGRYGGPYHDEVVLWHLASGREVRFGEDAAVDSFFQELIPPPTRLYFSQEQPPLWSPDGTKVVFGASFVFTDETGKTTGALADRLWVVGWKDDAITGPPRLVDVGPGTYGAYEWLADGRLAFLFYPEGERGLKAVIARVETP